MPPGDTSKFTPTLNDIDPLDRILLLSSPRRPSPTLTEAISAREAQASDPMMRLTSEFKVHKDPEYENLIGVTPPEGADFPYREYAERNSRLSLAEIADLEGTGIHSEGAGPFDFLSPGTLAKGLVSASPLLFFKGLEKAGPATAKVARQTVEHAVETQLPRIAKVALQGKTQEAAKQMAKLEPVLRGVKGGIPAGLRNSLDQAVRKAGKAIFYARRGHVMEAGGTLPDVAREQIFKIEKLLAEGRPLENIVKNSGATPEVVQSVASGLKVPRTPKEFSQWSQEYFQRIGKEAPSYAPVRKGAFSAIPEAAAKASPFGSRTLTAARMEKAAGKASGSKLVSGVKGALRSIKEKPGSALINTLLVAATVPSIYSQIRDLIRGEDSGSEDSESPVTPTSPLAAQIAALRGEREAQTSRASDVALVRQQMEKALIHMRGRTGADQQRLPKRGGILEMVLPGAEQSQPDDYQQALAALLASQEGG